MKFSDYAEDLIVVFRGMIDLYTCGGHTPKFQKARSIVSNMLYSGQIEVPKYGLNDEPLWYDEVF